MDGGGGGGEKSRRHRPMVQSSRGWDAAPHSGWGGQTIGTFLGGRGRPPYRRPSRRCVPRWPRRRCAPVFPARTSSPRPPMARTLRRPRAPLSPARVGWAGTAVGRPARSWAAVGRAHGWLRGVPGGRDPRGGGRAGWRPGPGPRGRVGSGPAPWGVLLCLRGPRRHLPLMAGPPVPFYQWASLGPGRPPFGGAWGWRVGVRLRHEWPGVRWWEAEVHLCCMQECKGGSGRPLRSRLRVGWCCSSHPIISFPFEHWLAGGQVSGPPVSLREGNAALLGFGCVRVSLGLAWICRLKHAQGPLGCCHRG